MSSQDLSLGKGKNIQTVNVAAFKGGVKRDDLKTDQEKSIFDAVDKNRDGIIDNEEMETFTKDLQAAASKKDAANLSKGEAKQFLKDHQLKKLKKEDLFKFVQNISQSSENIQECSTDPNTGNIVIQYKDGTQETIRPDKSSERQTTDADGNTTTIEYNKNDQVISEKIVDANGKDGSEVKYQLDADGNPVTGADQKPLPQEKTVVTDEGQTISTTNYENGIPQKTTITKNGGANTTVIQYDENGEPASAVETQGEYTVKNFIYVDGKPRETERIENKGQDSEKVTKFTYNEDGSILEQISELGGTKTTARRTKDGKTIAEEMIEGDKKTQRAYNEDGSAVEIIVEGKDEQNQKLTQNQLNSEGFRLTQVKKDGKKEYQLQYDGNGNTEGIIVQYGETPAAIAKKFGVPLDKLLEVNADKVQGKKTKTFRTGDSIKIPREMEANEKVLQGRDSSAQAVAKAKKAIAARERDKQLRSLGLKNYKRAGEKFTYGGVQYTVLGTMKNRERLLITDKKGNIQVASWDKKVLKEEYVSRTNLYDFGKKIKAADGKEYVYVEDRKGDKHGRKIVLNDKGQMLVMSGGKSKTDFSDRVLLRGDYVEASDLMDANQGKATVSGKNNVKYVKDSNGKVWYFDQKTGKALVKGEYNKFITQEAEAISAKIHDAADGWGTDEEKLKQGIGEIYSRDVLKRVNISLAKKDSDYAAEAGKMPIEKVIISESSGEERAQMMKVLVDTNTLTTKEKGNLVAREVKYQLNGYTSTAGLNATMDIVPKGDRETRLAAEQALKQMDPDLKADNGSYIRGAMAKDGWTAQEVDQFDSIWVANNVYQPGVDQEHRNGVIGRLCFDYDSKEALHKGLRACSDDPNSLDYKYFSQRAVQANKERGYKTQFKDQEAVQTYLAGRSNDGGEVDVGQLKACNVLLYKSMIPARVQAEEALYGAKKGNMSNVFDSMEPDVYDEMESILANGDVPGCKSVKDAYNKAMATAKPSEKVTIKANAILSNHVDFTQKEITDFCIQMMHSIDDNIGLGGSTGVSASHTNLAAYQTEQLKAILAQHPEVINDVKTLVQKGKFGTTTVISTPGGSGMSQVNNYTRDTKAGYLDLINNTQYIVSESVFYDENGNKITDPEQIEMIKKANMDALQGMREYVAELEREFKMGVNDEGWKGDVGNGIITYLGLGTDRDDVANKYREAKQLLNQLEAAAQGRLRSSNGKVVSAQSYAKTVIEKHNALEQVNADYKSSVSNAEMGIVLAPVIVATTVFTGGFGLTGWAAVGTATATTATVEGLIYGTDLVTSETGNTAENRAAAASQVLQDTLLAATSVKVGQYAEIFASSGAQAVKGLEKTAFKPQSWNIISKVPEGRLKEYFNLVSKASAKLDQATSNIGASAISKQANMLKKLFPNMTKTQLQKTSVILARGEAAGLEITSDTVQTLGQMYLVDGQFNEEGFIEGMILSGVGNTVGHMTSVKGDLKPNANVGSKKILDIATNDGKNTPGGVLGDAKFEKVKTQVKEELPTASPKRIAQQYGEADQLQASARHQGREVKQIIADEVGFVQIGKERIDIATADADALSRARRTVSDWADGTRNKEALLKQIDTRTEQLAKGKSATPAKSTNVVNEINTDVKQSAERILNGKVGAIGPHDASILADHLANNLNTVDEIQTFITDLKKSIGTDANGNMKVYQVQGKDQAAEVLKLAEAKMSKIKAHQADFTATTQQLDNALSADRGLSGEEFNTVRAFANKTTSVDELQTLIDKMSGSKAIKKSIAAKKLIRDMQDKVDILKAKSGSISSPSVKKAPETPEAPVAGKVEEPRVKNTPEPEEVSVAGKVEGSKVKDTPAAENASATPKTNESKVADSPESSASAKSNNASGVDPAKGAKLAQKLKGSLETIKDAEIPARFKKVWGDCKQRFDDLTSKLSVPNFSGSKAEILNSAKVLINDLKAITSSVTGKVKAKLVNVMNNIRKMLSLHGVTQNKVHSKITDPIRPEINNNEFCRVNGNNGNEIDARYIQNSIEVREHFYQAMESGEYVKDFETYKKCVNEAHKLAYAGSSGTNLYYMKHGELLQMEAGKFHKPGNMVNNYVDKALEVETIAKRYGDPYSADDLSIVKLDGIPNSVLPQNLGTRHVYPDGRVLDLYYKQMHRTSKEAIDLINNGASPDKILEKVAEHYQYAANARPYYQINNSLFMNEVNSLLTKAGMKPLPHGILDHAAQRLQPKAFKKYFADQYKQTALDVPSSKPATSAVNDMDNNIIQAEVVSASTGKQVGEAEVVSAKAANGVRQAEVVSASTGKQVGEAEVVSAKATNGVRQAEVVSASAVKELSPRPELNGYKLNPSKNYDVDEVQFAWSLRSKGYTDDGSWNTFRTNNKHSAWKMHLYSVDKMDYQQMADVVLPYLRDHNITHKCLGSSHFIEDQAVSPRQSGKAFTIYPKSQEEMAQVAKDLDYIIRNNNLQTNTSRIQGDRNLGDSGRLFYRYEFNSGKHKDMLIDMEKEYHKYCVRDAYGNQIGGVYDDNRGADRYLAADMSTADDPFYNFDPSNPNSQPGVSASAGNKVAEAEVIYASAGKQAEAQVEILPLADDVEIISVDGVPIEEYNANSVSADVDNASSVQSEAEVSSDSKKLKKKKDRSDKLQKGLDKANDIISDQDDVQDLIEIGGDVVKVVKDPTNIENWKALGSDAGSFAADKMYEKQYGMSMTDAEEMGQHIVDVIADPSLDNIEVLANDVSDVINDNLHPDLDYNLNSFDYDAPYDFGADDMLVGGIMRGSKSRPSAIKLDPLNPSSIKTADGSIVLQQVDSNRAIVNSNGRRTIKVVNEGESKVIGTAPSGHKIVLQNDGNGINVLYQMDGESAMPQPAAPRVKESTFSKIKRSLGFEHEGLTALRKNNPSNYQSAVESGLLSSISNGQIDKRILDRINLTRYDIQDGISGKAFSERAIQAANLTSQGKTLVTTLPSNTNPSQVSKLIANGEVCSIKGKLYANDNGVSVPLNISQEKFEQLFPPLGSSMASQPAGTNVCYFVSVMNSMMDSPSGRISLYKLLEQDGNDIIVNLHHSKPIRFANGKPLQLSSSILDNGADGMQLLEQAFLANSFMRAETSAAGGNMSRLADPEKLLNSAGKMASVRDAERALLGTSGVKTDKHSIGSAGENPNFANDVVNAFSNAGDNNFITLIWEGHAKSFKSFDANSKIVTFNDPYYGGVDIQMPLDKFLDTCDAISVNTKKTQVSVEKPTPEIPRSSVSRRQTSFQSMNTPLSNEMSIVAYTAEGKPIKARINNSGKIAIIKDGKMLTMDVKSDTVEPILEKSTNTFLIVRADANGKVSIVTSETPELPNS